jgi:hypothetical protein
VTRRSTSAGLSRSDTGERMPGSDGLHDYVLVRSGCDVDRFLKTLHSRCWLWGLGWMMVGAGGQLLERSIVDRMVGGAERLVFEGGPICEPPIEQDAESRRPAAFDGDALDTLLACPPLTIVEKSRLDELRAKERYRLAPEAAEVRGKFIDQRAQRLIARTGMSEPEAKRIIARQCDGILRPDIELPFDDPELVGKTVADVLTDPERFVGATLSDPLEGPEYGTCKAMIMRRPNGALWIHSFAHGRTIYELKPDARAARVAVEQAHDPDKTFLDLALSGDLDEAEIEHLRNQAAKRSGSGKRMLSNMLKEARKERNAENARVERELRAAARTDPRPIIPSPSKDAPWLPLMSVINEPLAASNQPPWRDIDGDTTTARMLRIPNMHAFTKDTENSLPPPEQWVLSKMDEMQTAEMIERYIDFFNFKTGMSVHLGTPFVRHYMNRQDNALKTLVAISTLPLVMPDGEMLGPDGYGFDAERGILFKIPRALRDIIPRREDCTEDMVRKAMAFLCEEWLCDVATDYTGKCTIIAAAMTVIERSLLSDRPAFFVTAGRRGGGKTTLIIMLIMAVTGVRPAAAAWATNEDERRKALLSYFMTGTSYILWDNIARGTQVGCPHIERSCTSAYYADRRLGVSEMVATAASTIHFFTGNNIGPRGDLASRSLHIRLDVDRPDPENREFKHPDPIGWTNNHRAGILSALYTIMLGNPQLNNSSDDGAATRFKMWWHLIGSAVEHAAALCEPDVEYNFQKLFLRQEEDDVESSSLADALEAVAAQWPGTFTAADVALVVNNVFGDDLSTLLREVLFSGLSSAPTQVSPRSMGRYLKRHIDAPVQSGKRVLALRANLDPVTKSLSYHVSRKPLEEA